MKNKIKSGLTLLLSGFISFSLSFNSFAMSEVDCMKVNFFNEYKITNIDSNINKEIKPQTTETYPDYWMLSFFPGLGHIAMGETTQGLFVFFAVNLGIYGALPFLFLIPPFIDKQIYVDVDPVSNPIDNPIVVLFGIIGIPFLILSIWVYIFSINDAKKLNDIKREEFLQKNLDKINFNRKGFLTYKLCNF